MSKEPEIKQFTRSFSYGFISSKLREYYVLTLPILAGVEEQVRNLIQEYITPLSQNEKYALLGISAYAIGGLVGFRFKARRENKKLDKIMAKIDKLQTPLQKEQEYIEKKLSP